MNKWPSAAAGILVGGAILYGGAEAIANGNEGSSNVEQVNACAKHLGSYVVGIVSPEAAKQEAEALKSDCQQFETSWPPTSVEYTKKGTETLVLAIPNVAAFSEMETPTAKVADNRNLEIKTGEATIFGVGGTVGGFTIYKVLGDGKIGLQRRKRTRLSPKAQ
jgi:hypothetical protein